MRISLKPVPVVPLLIGLILFVVGCAAGLQVATLAQAPAAYAPQSRTFMVAAVPLQVHEMQGNMNYLTADFATGGVLDGKEVYGFYPSTLTIYAGDTVNLDLVNPADDSHTFTISDLNLNVEMKGKAATQTLFVASKPGVYQFVCAEAEHAPYMWGQLVVLSGAQAH